MPVLRPFVYKGRRRYAQIPSRTSAHASTYVDAVDPGVDPALFGHAFKSLIALIVDPVLRVVSGGRVTLAGRLLLSTWTLRAP
jgi:hypothetical protein